MFTFSETGFYSILFLENELHKYNHFCKKYIYYKDNYEGRYMLVNKWIKKQIKSPAFQIRLNNDITHNISLINTHLTQTPDLVIREIKTKSDNLLAIIYISGLIDKDMVNNYILQPLIKEDIASLDLGNVIPIGKIEKINNLGQVKDSLLHGSTILIVNGQDFAYKVETPGWPQRDVKEPLIESSIRGAQQGFVETISQNIALIRKYLPDDELKIKEFTVGLRGKTKVSIIYIDDITNQSYLKIIEDRISYINIDAILNIGELEELIEDNSLSLFPQSVITERPDSVASHILQGRVALVMDGSPNVLILPVTFNTFFQSVDDYGSRWIVATFIRILRYLAVGITLFLPAIYIAAISYHYELIPLQLLISIAETRDKVPYPPILEAILMELVLEMLREAGIRLPAPIGQTVGIVGGIVIGQAAVEAGLVSNIMVIVVAMTAISSFIIPNQDMASGVRLFRFPIMIAAFLFGLLGIMIGLMIIVAHLISLKSLGNPYFAPITPTRFKDWKDFIFRFPVWSMSKRPISTRPKQDMRQVQTRTWKQDEE